MYMSEDIATEIAWKLAPCEPADFIKAYLMKDPSFEELLKSEFSIEYIND